MRKLCLTTLPLILSMFCSVGAAQATVKLAGVFGDNMVLQQGQADPVWGTADKGEEVTVTIAGQTHSAKADDDGHWKVTLGKLDATPESKSLEMTVKGSSGAALTLKNILVGEVWVCSGQSNMEMGIGAAQNGQKEIASAAYPRIRLFTVPKLKAPEPVRDVTAPWQECSPKTVGAGGWAGFSAAGYYFGRQLYKDLDVPIGLIHTSWGGTPADFWTSKAALEADPAVKSLAGKGENSRLYNGMIAPLIPFGIRGAVWYQGEANVGRAYQYRALLPAMIRNWRTDWGQGDFPFGIVQIAPYKYGGDGVPEAELWEAELMTAKSLPHTGIALTMDIGEIGDIHPHNKQEVGRRLALWAMAEVYGRDKLVHQGPMYQGTIAFNDGKGSLTFENVGGGLVSKDGKPLTEFTLAGEDKKFYPAEAEIVGDRVIVHSDQVKTPVAVRFAWHDTAQPNLANKEGLPAAPFRTDTWKGETEGR